RSRRLRAVLSSRMSCARSRGELDRLDDLRVAGAATEIAGERRPDRPLARMRLALEEICDRDHEPGRAEAALHRADGEECLLHAVERAVVREALDRAHVPPVELRSRNEARTDNVAVEPDGARSALPFLARVLRAAEAELVAQKGKEARRRLHVDHL